MRVDGRPGGLVFREPSPKPARPRAPVRELTCRFCGGTVQRRNRLELWWAQERAEELDDGADPPPFECRFCVSLIGPLPFWGGSTTVEESARHRIAEAGEAGWAMVLRVPPLGLPAGGRTISLDMGDVLHVARAGGAEAPGPASRSRSVDAWSVDVRVGAARVRLWPQEFAPMRFAEIMELRRAGQLEDAYAGPDDDVGYFTPPPALRAEIDATFGRTS